MAVEFLGAPDDIESVPPERIVAFVNPVSTNRASMITRLRELTNRSRELGVQVVAQETEPDIPSTVEKFQAILTDGDRPFTFTGDGGFRTTHAAAILAGIKRAFGHGGGGNADDLAHMLHTAHYLRNPAELVQRARASHLRPLRISAFHPGSTESIDSYAFAYFGTGVSRKIAALVSNKDFRERTKDYSGARRFMAETAATLKAVPRAEPFILKNDDDGHEQELVEYTIANGPRMAKKIRFGNALHGRVHLLHDEAAQMELTPQQTKKDAYRDLAVGLGKAAFGVFRRVEREDVLSFTLYSTKGDTVYIHEDGEQQDHPSGTRFVVQLAEETVPVLTTRRAA